MMAKETRIMAYRFRQHGELRICMNCDKYTAICVAEVTWQPAPWMDCVSKYGTLCGECCLGTLSSDWRVKKVDVMSYFQRKDRFDYRYDTYVDYIMAVEKDSRKWIEKATFQARM